MVRLLSYDDSLPLGGVALKGKHFVGQRVETLDIGHQGISCVLSAFAGLGAGRMATAGGEVFLLLGAAASLGGIALVVTLGCGGLMPQGVGSWGRHLEPTVQAKKLQQRKGGGVLRVLR